jgi:hypothetical protein
MLSELEFFGPQEVVLVQVDVEMDCSSGLSSSTDQIDPEYLKVLQIILRTN